VITTLLLHALNATGPGERITLDDIEARFRDLTGSATGTVEKAKVPLIGGGVAAVVFLLLLFYVLGRRRGRKRATMLEIRRIV
jgi:uncharacterized protein (TIGR03382 family)